jgi:hypothetical protein
MLSQVASVSENTNFLQENEMKQESIHHKKREDLDTGVSSVKQMNTHATMLLYVCILTVLLCCCLGRCLIVPLSQASNYEINSRKHFSKLDKNALLQ